MSAYVKNLSSYFQKDNQLLYIVIASFIPDNYYVTENTVNGPLPIEGMYDYVVPHCSATVICAPF